MRPSSSVDQSRSDGGQVSRTKVDMGGTTKKEVKKSKKTVSGRTSPGLNVKRFTIPKKQKDLLNEVELDSSEFLREVLPIIHQSYRDSNSKNKFNYNKVQLVHNAVLKREFLEKKREMKGEGRSEKELTESYAFMYVEKEETARRICKEGLKVSLRDTQRGQCLGNSTMGVYLSRYADVIKRSALLEQGMLLLFKILKGKVKSVPLTYGEDVQEPTPNFDCHVAKDSADDQPATAHIRIFDTSLIYLFDFDDEEADMKKRPRNVCPYAVVHFTYSETASKPPTASAVFNREPVTPPAEVKKTPTRSITIPETASPSVVAPCFPRDKVVTERPKGDKDRPFLEKYAEYSGRSYTLWSGQLNNKSGTSCEVSLLSFGLSFLPYQMPEALDSLKAIRTSELNLPTKVFSGAIPFHSRIKESQANGKYYVYAELHSKDKEDEVYTRFYNYLSKKQLVLKKQLKEKLLLYIFPTSKVTQKLGMTCSSHPKLLHCLFESYVPLVTQLTDIGVRQSKHKMKPNLESAPIHDIEKDHIKRMRFQSSLAKLFYEQNKELMAMGVKGDEQVLETIPPLVELGHFVENGTRGHDDQGQEQSFGSKGHDDLGHDSTLQSRGHEDHGHDHLLGSLGQEDHRHDHALGSSGQDQGHDHSLGSRGQDDHGHDNFLRSVGQEDDRHDHTICSRSRDDHGHDQALGSVSHEELGHDHFLGSRSHENFGHDHSQGSRDHEDHGHTHSLGSESHEKLGHDHFLGSKGHETFGHNHSQGSSAHEDQGHTHTLGLRGHEEHGHDHFLGSRGHENYGHDHPHWSRGHDDHRHDHTLGSRGHSEHGHDHFLGSRSHEDRGHDHTHVPPGSAYVDTRPHPRVSTPNRTQPDIQPRIPAPNRTPHDVQPRISTPNRTQPDIQQRIPTQNRTQSLGQPRIPPQNRTQPDSSANKPELSEKIKEMASRVHDMLTGGIDLGLVATPTSSESSREETDDEKITRMRKTLECLVQEREKLMKRPDKVWEYSSYGYIP